MRLDRIEKLIEEGVVRAARHPSLPLTIYNYTAKCQYEQRWCDVSRACRGLIVDDDGQRCAFVTEPGAGRAAYRCPARSRQTANR